MSRSTDMARYAPYALGAAALAVGLVLATVPELTGGAKETPPAAVDGGGVDGAVDDGAAPFDGSVPRADLARPERYVPDLTGDDVGELIVTRPGSAHDLVVAAGRLVWLTTEAATVRTAPLNGGAPRELFASSAADAFAGRLVVGTSKLYWSVERADGGPETIVALATSDVSADQPSPRPIITEGSPGNLRAQGDDLFWTDHGVIMSLPAGESAARVVVDTKRLIAGLASAHGRLAWLEVPYERATKGGHAVASLSLDDDEGRPRTLATSATDVHRDLLVAAGEHWVWVEGKHDGPWAVVRVAADGDAPSVQLAQTGAVTALTTDGSNLFWAELHGEGETAVALLRRMALQGGAATRLGRDSGPVPALAVHDGALYWATGKGIKRLALSE